MPSTQTIVRFGAAHCDVATTIKGERVRLPIRNDRDRFTLGPILCDIHGIVAAPQSPRVSDKERARRPSKNQPPRTVPAKKFCDHAAELAYADRGERPPRRNQPAPGIVGRKAIVVIHDDFEQRSPPADHEPKYAPTVERPRRSRTRKSSTTPKV